MFVCSCISQKGGAGKSTLALHLAVEATRRGYETAIVDLDPQGTAEAWGDWRQGMAPVVIPAKAGNLTKTLQQAKDAGADVIMVDTPPLAQADASAAARASDLILVPCRPRAFDLHAVRITASLVEMTRKPAFAVFNGGHPSTSAGYAEPEEVMRSLGLSIAPFRFAERALFHQATMTGQAAQELEPDGRAAAEVESAWLWVCKQANLQPHKHKHVNAGKHT